jgi:hypothetical protein
MKRSELEKYIGKQVRVTLQEMGNVEGILQPATSHSARYGVTTITGIYRSPIFCCSRVIKMEVTE